MDNIKILSGYCVLNIHHGVIYAAKGYKILKSHDNGNTWQLDGSLNDLKYGLIANSSRLLARLFRAEITNLLILQNGNRLLTAKKGIFVAQKNEKVYKKSFSVTRGNRPMNVCEDKNGFLYFGEYFSNPERNQVHIFKSTDAGSSWEVCYTFPENTIRHIHGIFYDEYEDLVWFATGDLDSESIIGNTSNSFKSVNIVKQGKQIYRTVQLLFYKEFIIYGTDTEYEKNYIYRLDRKDYKEYCLKEIQGSVLSSVNSLSGHAAISTAVEPSEVNLDTFSHIWLSLDGLEWKEMLKYEKDSLNPKYFQYGRVKFPRNGINTKECYFSGHALNGIDNKTVIFPLPVQEEGSNL